MNGTDPNGNDVVAIYPMLENNLCQLLVFDFDNHAKGAEQEDYANIDDRWKEEINALRCICKNLDVDAVVERSRSGRGAHFWIFFEESDTIEIYETEGDSYVQKKDYIFISGIYNCKRYSGRVSETESGK